MFQFAKVTVSKFYKNLTRHMIYALPCWASLRIKIVKLGKSSFYFSRILIETRAFWRSASASQNLIIIFERLHLQQKCSVLLREALWKISFFTRTKVVTVGEYINCNIFDYPRLHEMAQGITNLGFPWKTEFFLGLRLYSLSVCILHNCNVVQRNLTIAEF